MIRAVIAWSLHNRPIVLLGALALIAAGLHAAAGLNVEAYPDPTPPLVEVITQVPGASPEEMERLVGIPLETALNGMPGLEDLRSTSVSGLNDIKCQFSYGTEYVAARQEVLNRLSAVDGLPAGASPRLSPWSPTGEIVRYTLDGPGYTTNQLKAIQDWTLNRLLKQVPGVIDVTGFGGTVKQYHVLLDPRLMRQYGVTMRQVEEAVAGSNANVGGDLLSLGSQSHNVRALGLLGGGVDPLDPMNVGRAAVIEAEKLEDVADVVVATQDGGTPVFVRQVARVVVGHKPRLGVVGRAGRDDVVEGIVLMRKGEQALPVTRAVLAKFDEIEASGVLPEGVSINVFNRRTDLVNVTTENVLHNLLVGMGLVVVVLFVFLGDLVSAGIVALTIPMALLFAVAVISWRGASANLLSIGAVDFGIIVDSSVIIVENIYRLVSGREADRSIPVVDRVLKAAEEIQRPLFFSTTIILCAFIPLFAMTGPEGALFGPMADTYAYAIGGALLIALTLAPTLCSYLFRPDKVERETVVDRLMKASYAREVGFVLDHRWPFLALMAALLAASGWVLTTLGGEFMPELEEGNLWIRAKLPATIAREEAAALAPRLRAEIAEVPEVRAVMSHVGRPDDGTDVTNFSNLEFNVPLRPMGEWRRGMTRLEIQDELMARFESYPGIDFSFSQLIRDNVQEALSGVKGANSVKVFGTDLARLQEAAEGIVRELQAVPGVRNVGLFPILGQPNLEIRIDRRACARYGINVSDVEEVVAVAVGGRAFSQMVEGEKRFDIVLRLPERLRTDPTSIARIPVDVPLPDGSTGRIPLGQLAEVVPHEPGASAIYRENNLRFAPIKFSVVGRDLASTIAEARARVEARGLLPSGYSLEWSGEFAQMQEANRRLVWIVPVSVLLIAILLFTAFNSATYALMVMVNVLVATMGGIWALKLTGTPFSISAAVGFISIFGVAVQHGVLMITYFNQMRAEGLPVREAILRGAALRVRPVVMTSLTAILGLLPAALATSIGSQAQRPLAIVVVGGMIVTLLLSRYLMPVLYSFAPAPEGECAGPRPDGSFAPLGPMGRRPGPIAPDDCPDAAPEG